MEPILDVATAAGILPEELRPYGTYRAKVALSILDRLREGADGKLVITTAITPTKAGEGKTTTCVSLTQGLGALGKKVALRAARAVDGPRVRDQGRRHRWRLRPGRADGGHQPPLQRRLPRGHAPRTTCLAAALDASIYHGNPLGIDPAVDHVAAHDRRERPRAAQHAWSASAARRTGILARTSSSSRRRRRSWRSSRSRIDLQDLRARLGRIVVGVDVRRASP